ncbi:hypothetical protein [Marinifilum flexuosum]|uniref:hypothetical protein n=1 Tax=Marinifilum flexuosum TaxID=1117708 RepID=UPI002491C584|nr:hypothetical protein [Marinifilum flexuosum]
MQNNIERDNLTLFSAFLERLVSTNSEYKLIIDAIIMEARLLINNEKDLYSIDRDNFDIILYLEENASELIQSKTNFDQEDYKALFEMINQNKFCLQ